MTIHLGHLTNGAFSVYFEQGVSVVTTISGGAEVIKPAMPEMDILKLITKIGDDEREVKIRIISIDDD